MLVTGFPTPGEPANGIFNFRAAKALSESADVKVVYLRAWKPRRRAIELSNRNGIPVLTLAVPQIPNWEELNRWLYRSIGWRRVRLLVKECDLVHSVGLNFAGILGSAWAELAGVRHVVQLITDLERTLFLWGRPLVTWQRHVHGVACNSQRLSNQFTNCFPRIPNVRTVYRGVDVACYRPCGPVDGPLANQKPARFLYLGGFPQEPGYGANIKGGKTLLAAWHAAEKDLILAGASLLLAGPRASRFRQAGWLGTLRDARCVHVADRIHPDMVARYIRASDAVLVPSLQEGLPNVVMEASACGRPVFGSNTGGIPELIVQRETGLLLAAGDVESWRTALVTYATKVDELRVMGKRARQRMKNLFDSKQYAPNMLDLYATAMNEPVNRSS